MYSNHFQPVPAGSGERPASRVEPATTWTAPPASAHTPTTGMFGRQAVTSRTAARRWSRWVWGSTGLGGAVVVSGDHDERGRVGGERHPEPVADGVTSGPGASGQRRVGPRFGDQVDVGDGGVVPDPADERLVGAPVDAADGDGEALVVPGSQSRRRGGHTTAVGGSDGSGPRSGDSGSMTATAAATEGWIRRAMVSQSPARCITSRTGPRTVVKIGRAHV